MTAHRSGWCKLSFHSIFSNVHFLRRLSIISDCWKVSAMVLGTIDWRFNSSLCLPSMAMLYNYIYHFSIFYGVYHDSICTSTSFVSWILHPTIYMRGGLSIVSETLGSKNYIHIPRAPFLCRMIHMFIHVPAPFLCRLPLGFISMMFPLWITDGTIYARETKYTFRNFGLW